MPVVLLPTHRSYADFLIVSYLTFHYRLPFPTIAAGMDFIHMAYIGSLFREAGAFYIKRSFMEEDLYWAVFQEYIHVLVCQESAPLEFFLEGTRSRTGKSLRPKLGLLGCVCQCCWRQNTSDVYMVPINISYSRTLEEELYAYEMLGVPKPKESTSGLYKAKRILGENYGNIFIHFGKGVSARTADILPRECLSEAQSILPLSPVEMSAVECVGLQLVREQQKLAVVSTFSLIAHYLLQVLAINDSPTIKYTELLAHLVSLLHSTSDGTAGRAGVVVWEGEGSTDTVDEILRASLAIHKNIIHFKEDGQNLEFQQQNVSSSGAHHGCSIVYLLVQHYANQSIHALVRPALVWFAVSLQNKLEKQMSETIIDIGAVKERFIKLCSLFGHDFIFEKRALEEDFREGLERLRLCGGIKIIDGNFHYGPVSRDASATLLTYTTCLAPFILTHHTAVEIARQQEWGSEATLVSRIQSSVLETLEQLTEDKYYSALSLDSTRNAVRAITKYGGLRSVRANGSGSPSKLVPCESVLCDILQVLGDDSGVSSTPRAVAKM